MMVDDQETEEPEDIVKVATTAKEGNDVDIHQNELTGVIQIMVYDQKTEKSEDVEKVATTPRPNSQL